MTKHKSILKKHFKRDTKAIGGDAVSGAAQQSGALRQKGGGVVEI